MFQIEMPYPVFTLDRKELLPAGSLVTEEVAKDLAALGRLQKWEHVKLLEYGTVKGDLERFMVVPPYNDIFEDRNLVKHLFEHMQSVDLPLPLLKSLDYFRQHDFHTYRHILMVFTLSTMLIHEMSPAGEHHEEHFMAGPSHDFGKICVPLHVLKKTSPLTRQERDLLIYHPLSGYLLLSYYLGDHEHPAVISARDHHERRNGSGYPRGIEDLSPMIEMIAACDVYDALLSPRPYRPLSYDNRTALEELTRMADNGELGLEFVTALVACNRVGRPAPDRVIVSRDVRGTPPLGNCYGLTTDDEEAAIKPPGAPVKAE